MIALAERSIGPTGTISAPESLVRNGRGRGGPPLREADRHCGWSASDRPSHSGDRCHM